MDEKLFPESIKGFIGPIGDDIPSLIPLIFALLLFFSSFSFALNEFDKQNSVFDQATEASKITAELRSAAYIDSLDSFQKVCDSLGARQLKFRAGLIELNPGEVDLDKVFKGINLENLEFYKDPEAEALNILPEEKRYFSCSNVDDDAVARSGRYTVVSYPVALETSKVWSESDPPAPISLNSKFAVRPMLLVIVVWAY